jgi:hypothetical protein
VSSSGSSVAERDADHDSISYIAHQGATPWLGGAGLGALDLHDAVVSKWSGAREHLATSRPALHATLRRIERHPLVAPVFEKHWPPQ